MKNYTTRYLCLLPIVGISLSRVYLGVHSVYDVLGGLVFGFLTIYLWKLKFVYNDSMIGNKNIYKIFGVIILVIIGAYSYISMNLQWQPMVPMSIGALVGFLLSLPWIINKSIIVSQQHSIIDMAHILALLIILIAFVKFIPIIKTNNLLFNISISFKYAFVVFCIFVLFPKLKFICRHLTNEHC
jgi:hypothetical protein